MDPAAVMAPAAVMVTAGAGGEVGPTEDEPSGKTGGCRSRSDASSVVAPSGRAGRSSGCVDASSVDAGITTDWCGLDGGTIWRSHAPTSDGGKPSIVPQRTGVESARAANRSARPRGSRDAILGFRLAGGQGSAPGKPSRPEGEPRSGDQGRGAGRDTSQATPTSAAPPLPQGPAAANEAGRVVSEMVGVMESVPGTARAAIDSARAQAGDGESERSTRASDSIYKCQFTVRRFCDAIINLNCGGRENYSRWLRTFASPTRARSRRSRRSTHARCSCATSTRSTPATPLARRSTPGHLGRRTWLRAWAVVFDQDTVVECEHTAARAAPPVI